jgi:hypothetical protein
MLATSAKTLAQLAAANFPTPKGLININNENERPTLVHILRFEKHLRACAITIPLPGETLGLLGAVMNTTKYKSINSNVTFTPPTDPGPPPTMPTPTTRSQTAAAAAPDPTTHTNTLLQHQQDIQEHTQHKNTYDRYVAGLAALTNLILSNIDHKFIDTLNNEWTGFTQVTPDTIMTYIKTEYGTVSDDELTENEAKLNEPWDPTTPIQVLYDHIEECKIFAEAGKDPIPERTILRKAYMAIKNTGMFDLSCDTWDDKATTTKTWNNFKLFFSKEENKVRKHTTSSTGFSEHTTNAILQLNDTILKQQEQIELLNNRQPLQEIHPTNNVTELQNLTNKVNLLFSKLNNIQHTSPPTLSSPTPTATPVTRNPPSNSPIQGYDKEGYPVAYCWTHGIGRNLKHTSCTCKYPTDGHKKEATLNDKMGGATNTIQPKPRKITSA